MKMIEKKIFHMYEAKLNENSFSNIKKIKKKINRQYEEKKSMVSIRKKKKKSHSPA